jgi:hypothetical protein
MDDFNTRNSYHTDQAPNSTDFDVRGSGWRPTDNRGPSSSVIQVHAFRKREFTLRSSDRRVFSFITSHRDAIPQKVSLAGTSLPASIAALGPVIAFSAAAAPQPEHFPPGILVNPPGSAIEPSPQGSGHPFVIVAVVVIVIVALAFLWLRRRRSASPNAVPHKAGTSPSVDGYVRGAQRTPDHVRPEPIAPSHGWRPPGDEQLNHSTASQSPPAIGSPRRSTSVLVGEVRSLEKYSRGIENGWAFRLQCQDCDGNPLAPIDMELPIGQRPGRIVEGDRVEVYGKWRRGKPFKAWRVRNLANDTVTHATQFEGVIWLGYIFIALGMGMCLFFMANAFQSAGPGNIPATPDFMVFFVGMLLAGAGGAMSKIRR